VTVTLPEAARYVLQVGSDADDVFATGVETISAAPAAIAPPSGPTPDPALIVIAALGAAVLIGLGLVALRRAG
jgi:hypothetical protein